MSDKKGFSKLFLLVIGLFIGFQIGQWIGDSSDTDVQKVQQVIDLTKRYYLDEISADSISENAIEGILSKLDPHSIYISQEVQRTFEEQLEGNFEGIGIEFQIINDTITVVSPIVGTPSDRLGIMPGDRIIKIDDTTAVGFNNTQVIQKLRGKKGSIVIISIYRPSEKSEIDYEIERDVIPINSVEISLMLQDSVGYISVTRFAEKTSEELYDALNSLSNQGMKYLLLDLRNNPGGLFEQSVEVADFFISDEKLIVYTRGRIEEFNEERRASQKYPFENIPLIVLINRGSASASEIVAGAVQDWDRGLIVGETSFGKGLVQRPFLLNDNSAIRLSISKYYTPSGRAIQRNYKSDLDYYSEIMIRDEVDSDNFDHNQESDSLKQSFLTSKGRKVYEGGGITPDYNVSQGSLTKFTAELRSKNIFYQFVRDQIDNRKIVLSEDLKSDLALFLNENIISESKLGEFKKFVEEKEIELNSKEFNDDLDYITSLLKAYFAKEYFNSEGWYSVLINQDEQINKSLTLLKKSQEMILN